MPFDALVAPSRPISLSDMVGGWGVVPVGDDVLLAHKRAQLERFSPSFWYSHQSLLPVALLGSVGCMAASGGLANRLMSAGSVIPGWLTLGWLCVMFLLIACGVFRAKAGSSWEERWVPVGWLDELGVPAPIAELARDLHRVVPGSSLILGQLVQEQVVLDPYLLLEREGEVVCLGIWDEGRVIACAG